MQAHLVGRPFEALPIPNIIRVVDRHVGRRLVPGLSEHDRRFGAERRLAGRKQPQACERFDPVSLPFQITVSLRLSGFQELVGFVVHLEGHFQSMGEVSALRVQVLRRTQLTAGQLHFGQVAGPLEVYGNVEPLRIAVNNQMSVLQAPAGFEAPPILPIEKRIFRRVPVTGRRNWLVQSQVCCDPSKVVGPW